MPNDGRLGSQPAERGHHVVLTVGARKQDHPDAGRHWAGSSVTDEDSITGLASKRWQRASTSDRAESSSWASTTKRKALPARTPEMPSNPRAGRARSMVAP